MDSTGPEARLGQRLVSLESEAGQEDGRKRKEVERYISSQSQAWGGKGGSIESRVTARLSTLVRSLKQDSWGKGCPQPRESNLAVVGLSTRGRPSLSLHFFAAPQWHCSLKWDLCFIFYSLMYFGNLTCSQLEFFLSKQALYMTLGVRQRTLTYARLHTHPQFKVSQEGQGYAGKTGAVWIGVLCAAGKLEKEVAHAFNAITQEAEAGRSL